MPDYRLYLFENGKIVQGQFVVADDAVSAIETARDLAGDHTAELWDETVKVHIFNPVLTAGAADQGDHRRDDDQCQR